MDAIDLKALNVSSRMHDELIFAANFYANAHGIVAYCPRRTEDALIRRGLITYDTNRNDHYPVITLKGWAYLEASIGFRRRAEDKGRLSLSEALEAAYPAEYVEPVEDLYREVPEAPARGLTQVYADAVSEMPDADEESDNAAAWAAGFEADDKPQASPERVDDMRDVVGRVRSAMTADRTGCSSGVHVVGWPQMDDMRDIVRRIRNGG